MKTIVVANQKGGTGKSTVACHVAFFFQERGKRVLFLDCDPQANSSATMKASGATVATVKATAFYNAAPFDIEAGDGITLVEADRALADVERSQGGAFRPQLVRFADRFDVCIIDTAPSANVLQVAPLTAADFVISPVEMENYSIQGATTMIQTILGVKKLYNPTLEFLGMLPNRLKGTSPRQKAALADLLTQYPQFVFEAKHGAKIGERQAIPEALAGGQPVWALKKSGAREAADEMQAVLELVFARVGV